MNFCRSICRRWFVANRKAERKNEKKLRRGSVHNLLTTSLQKILLSAAGISMFVSPLFGASKSNITALGTQTKVSYDDVKKIHTITTTKIQGVNAFNAFKDFTLSSNEIANLYLPNNTKNLLNFVSNQIDINGTLNSIKDSKIGGNLYFLSSEGLILGNKGVINAGAFYAMIPSKDFMKRFINDSSLVSSIKDYDVNLILDKKISNYNVAKKNGVTIDTYGKIKIYGQINTINGIGLYAGGTSPDENGDAVNTPLVIANTAKLNTFSSDQLNLFNNLVNTDGISIPTATDIVANQGKIELVSVQDNTHMQSTFVEKVTGYSMFGASSKAFTKVQVDGNLTSRGDINIQSYASNGAVEKINSKGVKSFGSNNKVSSIISEISFSGNAVAEGNITLEATADNENISSSFNAKDIALSILGGSVKAFPLNVNADVLFSKTKSKVDVEKGSILDAKLALKIDAITNSSQQQGTKTAASVSKNVQEKSKLGRYLPAGAAVYAESDCESIVNFDGKAISRADSINEDDASISLRAESNSELDITATAKTSRSLSPMQASLAIGKTTNKATLTIGENASFETKQDVEIVSETNSESYIEAASKGNKTEYFIPAVGIALFNSDSIINIEKTNINLDNQEDSFTVKAINNILGDELYAEAGITSDYPWEAANKKLKDDVVGTAMEKFKINAALEWLFGPDNDPAIPKPKPFFNLTGAVAYGGGTHNSKINVKPGAKIITSGDLVLDSKTYIHDTKYDASSYNYPESDDDNNPSAKTGLGLAVLVSDYDYNSNVIIDDSTTSAKTQFVGNSVTINSYVEQPYNRVKVLIDALKNAASKLKDYFTVDEHKEICDEISGAAEKLSNSNGGGFGDVLTIVLKLKDLVLKETIGDDSMVKRLISVLTNALAFKDYTNYLNYTASSYVNSSEGDTKLDFAGSIFVGSNKVKSNLFVGKNTVINSQGDGDDRNIELSSKTEIENTAMVGGVPLIAQNIGGEEAVSIGGSAIAHTNDSVSELLIADSAKIGSDNTEKLSITSYNYFKPVDVMVGASSASTGFNLMASVITSDSKANVLIDNSVNLAADTLRLNAYNNTSVTNTVGSIMLTDKVGVGVGAAVTILTKESKIIYDDNDLYWQKIRKELGLRKTDPTNSEVSNNVATITADIVEAVAKTTGTINTIGVAGSVAVDDRSKYNKISDKATMFNDFASDSTINTGVEYLEYKLAGKVLGVNNQNQEVPNAQQQAQNQQQAENNAGERPSLSLSANGSVGVNKITNTTKVDLNKANIKFNNKSNAKIDVSAINSAHHLSFAGAAGIIAQGGNGQGTTVGIDGSVAVNLLNNDTTATIRNSNIYDAKQINSLAINGGDSIAAALGLSIIAGSHDSGKSGSGAVNASVNLIDNKVTSKLDNTNAKALNSSNKASMAISAYERDVQVTGGISASVGKQKGAVGVSVDVSKINNTLTAEVSKGAYKNMNNVEVNALQATTIVNAGVALSVAAGVDKSVAIAGAGVYAELTNTTNSNIKNATIDSESLSVNARDIRSTDKMVEAYEKNLERNGSNVSFIDREGKDFYTDLDTATGTTDLLESSTGRKGSLLVTAAVSGSYGGVSVGLGAAINEVDNKFNVNVSNSTINSNSFTAKALSYTTAINVAAGAAISNSAEMGSGAGSAAWSDIRNTSKVIFENNTITSKDFKLKTLNDALLVGVGGTISASTGGGLAAVGASLSYNSIENTANTKLTNNTINVKGNNKGDFSVESENTSKLWGVAIEVGANAEVSVGGTVSINEIDNSATSSISSSTVGISGTNYKSLNVLATDSADIKSLSGMISQGSKAAVGGSVAVNKIKGDTTTELDKVKFKADSTKLESYSDSNILTLALGCSVGGKVAVDGTVVVDNNSRNVYSTINKSTTDNATGTVDVATKRFGNTGSMAVVITGSGGVSAGAGVSVNRMTGTAKTKLSGNNLTVKNLNATSISDQDITNIGIAGAAGGTLGLSGSVSVNTMNNDTITEVSGGGKIISENNIGVIAQSDDSIKNYAGVLSVGIGVNADVGGNIPANPNLDANANDNRSKFQKFFSNIGSGLKKANGKAGGMSAKFGGVGIGVAVSVNSLNGKTNSFVDGVDLTAKGKDSNSKVTLKDNVENSAINDTYVDSKTIDIHSSLADDRKERKLSGIVVDSSSTHTVKAFIASAGVSGKVAVNANVNVNNVGGETNAYINNSTINKGLNGKTAGDVNVYAKDFTNTSGFIGNASIAGTASVGASADTNKVTRNTYAKATNIKTGSVAKAFDVKAISKQGMSSFVVGLAASMQVSVAGNISVTLLNSITSSLIDNSNISVNSMDTGADHYARSHVMAGSAGIGLGTAGVGAAVVVTNDKSQSLAKVDNSTIGINSGYAGDVKINSNNNDKYDVTAFAVGAGLYAGVAGTVAVNYMENQVDTTVSSSYIGTSASRAKSVEIKSKDVSEINTDAGSGAAGAAGVGAIVNVDTFDGQTNTNISKTKVYSTNDVKVGASEERNSKEFACSVSAGLGGLSANVLVINSGKKLDFSETESKDVKGDVDKSLDMVDKALDNDYVTKHNQGTLSDAELKQILGNQPSYSASKDGKAVTLTKIEGSTIDSKSGKFSSETKADGKIGISSNGGTGGLVGVMGNFGFIYDNKNVNSQFTNSTINAYKGIDIYSTAGGNTSLEMTQGSAGSFDYSGAFSYVFMNNNTSVGLAGSNLINKTNNVNIVATDETSGNTNAKGFQFGGGAIGTIFSKVNNTSNTNTTIGKTKIDNAYSTASNTINISATKNNKLVAEAYAGTGGALAVTVISPVTKDYGKSAVTLGSGNVFGSKELNVYSTNKTILNSFMKAGSGGFLGAGVGDVSAYQFGSSNLTVNNGSKYNVDNVNYVANIISDAVQESKAYTVSLVDIKANRVDSIASQTVNVNVDFAKNNYLDNTILNVRGENRAKSNITVEGVGVGAVLSVCNNKAEANNDLVTNVNVKGSGDPSSFGQINVVAKSEAVNSLYANGDGGGLIAVSPYAGSVESNMNLKANANISGNMLAEKINADAVGVADYKGSTSSVQGSFAGGNGAITEANITMDTNVKVGESAKLTAKEIALKATNDIKTGFERNGLNTKSSMYGGFGGSVARSRQNITATALVDIGKKASLIAEDAVNIDAFTQTDLKNSSKSTGGGIGSHPSNRSDTEITLNDYINTGEGSLIQTTEKYADINLATSYNFLASYTAYSEVEGSAGGSTSATSHYYVTNNNKIDLKGNIYSTNDINIYTDRNSKGVVSNFKLYGNAEAYTRSVIPWSTDAILECDIKRNNNINVGSDSLVRSIRHTTMNADAGKLNYTRYTKEYTWYSKDEKGNPIQNPVTTVGQGTNGDKLADNNAINVDGKVIAGIENKVNIKIDGKVMFDNSATGDGIVRTPTITSSSEEYKNRIKYGTMEYANKLFKRYEEVSKLCAENGGTLVGLNYEAEKQRLIGEMEKYGLYDSKTGKLARSLPIDYIELPDMVSSGGNVYLNIDNGKKVTGNGLIQAKGAPEIKVENNSNLYMIVNDLSILEPGGEIFLKDLALGNNAKSSLAVKEAKTDAAKNSLIDIRENWEGAFTVNYTDPSTKKKEIVNYTPLSNLEINGHIENDFGQANFFNAYKDIIMQGKTAKDSASIQAATISISAPKGSIAQGYTEGITNIGFTPELVLKQYANDRENEFANVNYDTGEDGLPKGYNLTLDQLTEYENKYKTAGKNVNESSSGVWLAGGSIFLNGDDININGTVQSGYSQFVATLENCDSVIERIKQAYTSKGSPEVTDAYLREYCKLNQSGMLWDKDTETYKYVVQAYYNPQTDKVILEDVNSQGGKIYLTGRISNTSNGKIFAADGASDINITNKTGKDLVANILDVGEREGLIRIMDLGRNTDDKGNKILATLTEMTSKDTKEWYVTSKGQSENPDKVSGVSSEYNPQKGLTYNWSTGYQSVNLYTYMTSYDFTIWGAIDYNEQHWSDMQAKMSRGEITPEVLSKKEKLPGTYIGNYTDLGNNGYQLLFINRLGTKDGPYTFKSTTYDNWTHFSGTDYYWTIYKEGSTETFKHSLKADRPIKIGFIHGNGDINVETNSNLTLASDVISKNSKGKYGIKLTASNGSIEQTGGKIYADNIWMNATNGIGADNAINQQMQSTSGVLSAITANGDVNLLSLNKAGENNSSLKLTANTDNGNVSVLADASLLNGAESVNAKGNRIDLISNYGSIGTGNSLLKIQAGQSIVNPGDTLSASVNATALKDVALEQTSGDMRIGRIVSKTGDVYINSDGSLIDALPPSGTAQTNESADNLIAKWKSLGIISEDGKDNSAEKKKEVIEGYKTNINTLFERYNNLKEYYTSDEHKNETDGENYKEYNSLKEMFGSYTSADKWLEAQNKDKNSEYYRLQNEVTYGWTQDQLLYAIQSLIINKESGSTTSEKDASDANIKGRNIIINAKGGIGSDEVPEVVDISNLQSEEGLDSLKKLAAAEASDVKWGYDGDNVDENKATINRVNGILIDASGYLQANAKGNVYLEDVNKNAINITKVDSGDGNIRIYGKNGIYNANSDVNSTILSGKDLILESGNGSIGSSTAPITTDMSGYVTARSNSDIWLYQNGANPLIISAMYAGGNISIRAMNSILSVYNGVQADELGYINANGDLTLLSDQGDIGEANGKGLRIKLTDDKLLNAEADSIYIKGFGETLLNLGRFIARNGDIGIDAKLLDLFLKNDMGANNIELLVRSLTQINGSLIVKNFLNVVTDNGILLDGEGNNITVASFVNNKKGHIKLVNNKDLTLENAVNKAEGCSININNKGSVTAKNGLSSKGAALIWSDGDIDIQKDSNSKEWMGLYANNGGIKTKSLNVGSINLSASKNGLTAEDITSDDYIIADVGEGDISVGNLSAAKGETRLITQNGKVTANSIKADKSVSVVAYNGDLKVDTIKSRLGYVEAAGYNSFNANEIEAGSDFFVGSLGDMNITSLYAGKVEGEVNTELLDSYDLEAKTSYLIGKNLKVESINVENNFDAYADENFKVNTIRVEKDSNLYANNNIDIDKINTGEDLTVTSLADGDVNITEVYSENGSVGVTNENGNTTLTKVNAGDDIHLKNNGVGDIIINDSITTRNNGSLYVNINDGELDIKSGTIDGEASIYSEKGNISLTKFNVNDDLNVRAKDGNVVIYDDTNIGGNATLKSDTDSVGLGNAYVGEDLNISAQKLAYIEDAVVGGSMQMKGLEEAVEAHSLEVGKDLIINTNTGNIIVENATVGEDSYISIDGDGGNIKINKIKTGKDFVGDLIITSQSEHVDKEGNPINHIKINDAVAADRLIINSYSNIDLKSAYALGGNLEVLAAGDVVAELLKAAKETFIATFKGIVDVSKVISGDSLTIFALVGSIKVDELETTNPDADISIGGLASDISVSNASTTRDLNLYTITGDIYLDNVHVGQSINIGDEDTKEYGGTDSKVEIKNTVVNQDIKINIGNGNVNLANTQVGNDLNAELDGTMNIDNTEIVKNAVIRSGSDSNINISTSKFGNVDLTNKGKALIKDSSINSMTASNDGELELTTTPVESLVLTNNSSGIASIHDTTVNSMTASNDGELTLNSVTGNNMKLTSKGNVEVNSSKIANINSTISGNAVIDNLESTNMISAVSGKSSISNSSITNYDLTNTGESVIKDSAVTVMTAANSGSLELTTTPVEKLDLNNKSNGKAQIHDTTVSSMTAANDGKLEANNLKGDKVGLTGAGNTNISDSNIKNIDANVSGNTEINNLTNNQMTFANSGVINISESFSDNFNLTNTGETTVANSEVKNFNATNDGKLDLNAVTGNKYDLTSKGNVNINDSKIANINSTISGNAIIDNLESANMTSAVSGKSSITNSSIAKLDLTNSGESVIKDSTVTAMTAANNKGKLDVNNINGDKFDLTSSANSNIVDSNIKSVNAKNSGELTATNLTSDKLVLTSEGNTNIDGSSVKSVDAENSGKLEVNSLTSDNLKLTSSGNANIANSNVKSMNADVSGKLEADKITSDKLVLTSKGETLISDSEIINVNANVSGKATVNNLTNSQISMTVSGETTVSDSTTDKIKVTNTGKTSLNNLDVSANANIVNKQGSVVLDKIDVANNLDVDSTGGNINLNNIDVHKDFNFALAGNSGVKFTDITIDNDFNVYAGKAVLNGSTLNVGNDLHTYTYSKYSAPKASFRAAVAPSSGTGKASEKDEGFSLILDQLNIGGGLYVDNPDVTIKVKESQVGHDVNIDAGKENIQIDKLDVDGGNLDVKGKTGSIKLGTIKVDNDTKIDLGSGNLEVSDLNSKQEIDFRVGGNIKSDKNIETQNKSVNMVAGGSVDAYKVLAKQQGNIEAVNGDIILGQIDGRTLVFKQDTNDRTLRIREANVETTVTAGADYIDIDMINQTAANDRLGIDFTRVNGRAMDNVIIRDVKTDTGVNMFNLVSTNANIHVSNEIFNLTKTYLLRMGNLSNTNIKFRLYGNNPVYSKEPDVIAFFSPMKNHKSYADISFTNEWRPERQDYYPLTGKNDYRRMFNQYTVVQDFETMRLAYEKRLEDLHDDAYGKFDYRKLDNSKSFYVNNAYDISSDGEMINLDDIEVPVGIEFDSANGELKAVGTHLKAQRVAD